MGRLKTFNITKALQLYHELKNDFEIAETLGIPKGTITSWRQRGGLPTIAPRRPRTKVVRKIEYKPKIKTKPKYTPKTHKTYRDYLTPLQANEMNQFLRVLSKVGRIAVKAGVKPDVGAVISVWRNGGNNNV